MWLSKLPQTITTGATLALLLATSACTVEPLNGSRTNNGAVAGSTKDILAATPVGAVKARVGQQVRNALLFAMNGGELRPGGRYTVDLAVISTTQTLAIENSSLATTAAQVSVTVDYKLTEQAGGKLVSVGKRRSIASFDRTPQSFANERAERDAQNRAAKDVAQQVYLAVAQSVAGR